jgi:hypothetical protein
MQRPDDLPVNRHIGKQKRDDFVLDDYLLALAYIETLE